MKRYFENLARALLGQAYSELDAAEQKVIDSIAEHTTVTENVNDAFGDTMTFGQQLADKVASFGGSWTFIGLFFAFIACWVVINTCLLYTSPSPRDA